MIDLARPFEIYTLTDPRTGAVRYVGATSHGKARLTFHCSAARKRKQTATDKWVAELLLSNLRPLFTVIDEGIGDSRMMEEFWVMHYRQSGADLTNCYRPGSRNLRDPAERERFTIHGMSGSPGVLGLGFDERALSSSNASEFQQLWRTRNICLSRMAERLCGFFCSCRCASQFETQPRPD
jgi:hypothetical protein